MRATVLVCCLVIAAGCGSSDPKSSSILRFERAKGTSSAFVLGDRSSRVPPKRIYEVFSRPQQGLDLVEAISARLRTSCKREAEEDEESPGSLGDASPATGRVLLDDVGARPYDLVAMTTEHGGVAFSLEPKGSATCARPTSDGLVFAAQLDPRDAIVFGLVGDDVTSVDLVIDGETRQARLGQNGFAVEIPSPVGKTLQKIVLHHADGSTTEFPATRR
jgi:hypothetical protein